MRALICVQAFPPLLKQAGGVAKDYFALCRALIDGLGWKVTLMSPVDILAADEPDVERWLASGALRHAPVQSMQCMSTDGIAIFLDFFSLFNTWCLVQELLGGMHDLCILDDSCMRLAPILLMRGLGLPTIATTHSDVPSHPLYEVFLVRFTWYLHMLSCFVATIHATVANVYADILKRRYSVPVHAIWPPVLWSCEFQKPPSEFEDRAAIERTRWISLLGYTPKAFLLFAGRWSIEKRIHLLLEALPDGCALVIVGDSDSEYADLIESSRRQNVLPLRGMLGAEDLRIAYAACDIFVSASICETLGNTVIEAWSAGKPVAIQPAGGHLEFVRDSENSYLIDYDDATAAEERLAEILSSGAGGAVEPALSEMGEHFRSLDFPNEIRRVLIEPALDKRAAWRQRKGWYGILEWLIRASCLLSWSCLWLTVAVVSRVYFAVSRDPSFTYIAAGRAMEFCPTDNYIVPSEVDEGGSSAACAAAQLLPTVMAKAHSGADYKQHFEEMACR